MILDRPAFIAPQIPTLVEEPPTGSDWVHEIKHDGYRTILTIEGPAVRAFTRRGHDWSERYAGIVEAARKVRCRSAVIDGEMVVQDAKGVADFNALQNILTEPVSGLAFIVFDLLFLNGEDLRRKPLLDRKTALRAILPRAKRSPILYSEHVEGDGQAVFEAAAAMGLEGIVSKRSGSLYRSGPSKTWLKMKAMVEEDMIVLGTELGDKGIPVAHLAREGASGLAYVGKALISMSRADRDALWESLKDIRRPKPPLPSLKGRGVEWVAPRVGVRVRHLKGGTKLRHASVKALSRTPGN